MLIDSDGHGGGEASAAPTDAEALFKRLKRDIKGDYTSKVRLTGAKRPGRFRL